FPVHLGASHLGGCHLAKTEQVFFVEQTAGYSVAPRKTRKAVFVSIDLQIRDVTSVKILFGYFFALHFLQYPYIVESVVRNIGPAAFQCTCCFITCPFV